MIRLLRAGAGRDAVVAHLSETASAIIGCAVSDSRNGHVADRLLALEL